MLDVVLAAFFMILTEIAIRDIAIFIQFWRTEKADFFIMH
jgi:hypothetical protein